MRRRIYPAGATVALVSLIVGVGVSGAAGQHHRTAKHLKPKAELLRCSSSPTTVPPQGQANVDQPPSGGDAYGPITCSSAGFASGVLWAHFTVPDSGDMVGTYKEYFGAGSIRGTFDLGPNNDDNPIGSDTFASQSFEGQVTVTDGTGAYKGVKGKNHKGTMSCNSSDSVHMTCTENVMVLIPPPATTAGTGTTGPSGASKTG